MNPTLPTIGHLVTRLDVAGADALAADVATALRERFRFVFLSLGPTGVLGQRLTGQAHKVVQLRHHRLSPLTPLRIRHAIRRYRIDLLHTHQFTPHALACLARLGRAGPPIVMTDHTRDPNDRPHAWRTCCHRLLARPQDQAVASAEHIRDALAENDGLRGRPVHVIRLGIDPHRFDHADDDQRTVARKLLGVAGDELVVIQVARFAAVKDHATAIHAFALAHDQVPQARLVLIGDGPTREAAQRLAWDLGVADHTLFLGTRSDVDALLPGAEVCLLTSLAEGTPPTVLEAMAARLPVVATSVGGVPEAVTHGQTGLLCPPRDAPALAHNLAVLLRDPRLRRRMGEAGRQRVLDKFTRKHTLDTYAALYDRMLNPEPDA